MKQPGPRHPIEIRPLEGRVRVLWHGRAVADSRRALELREAGYPPVYYFPRDDVDLASLTASDHRTHCPYKGEASYWSLTEDGARALDAVWSYEDPNPAVGDIAGAMAFDPGKVEAIEVTEA